jgi:predicted N-acetyltransferase YhbS
MSKIKMTNVEICRAAAPLDSKAAWEIESLLVKIFEYGDYSFRSVLLDRYHRLNCIFFLAKYQDRLIGAAGCLLSRRNAAVSILGPVGVDMEYRGQGIGTKLIGCVIDFLKKRNCKAVYLGISDGNPVAGLYKKLGFKKYQGIVMRLLLCSEKEFKEDYVKCSDTKICMADWGDFPATAALMSLPCSIYTFDFRQSIFSSRYVEPDRFLSVFPEMMKVFQKYGGFANVLITPVSKTIVGIAQIGRFPGQVQRHIAALDFYVHDNFIEQAEHLVRTTIMDSVFDRINCYCLACDDIKRNILEAIGAEQIAVLPENACINKNLADVLVYQIRSRYAAY